MIIFENRGEIDPTAMTTFGLSVKVGDNPIGFFGTGLKYAIAVLLRTGHRVTVHSGEDTMRFSTRRGNVRGKDFEFVEMTLNDGAPASIGFTTDLGKTWLPWMAYRELYCNTRDEGGEVYTAPNADAATDPRRDLTQIRVEGEGIEQIHTDSRQYFLEGEPDLVVNEVGIYRRPSQALFYRGIRVLTLPKPSLFTYNLLNRVELTEDRTMAHPFMAEYYLRHALARCDDPEILEAALTATADDFEAGFDYQHSNGMLNPTFLATVGRLSEARSGAVVPGAMALWNATRPKTFIPSQANLSADQQATLDRAMDRAVRVGFAGYPVSVVESVPDFASAIVMTGHIYIAVSVLDEEDGALRTILDRWSQAVGQDDPTRDPTDVLLDALVGISAKVAEAA